MSPSARRLAPLLLLLPVLAPQSAPAQSLAIPFGTISQRIDSTTITVALYRPSVRRRTVFGRLVRPPGHRNGASLVELRRHLRAPLDRRFDPASGALRSD